MSRGLGDVYKRQEMDWLGECVEGSLPRYDQLDVRTLGLLEINGLSSLKETTL